MLNELAAKYSSSSACRRPRTTTHRWRRKERPGVGWAGWLGERLATLRPHLNGGRCEIFLDGGYEQWSQNVCEVDQKASQSIKLQPLKAKLQPNGRLRLAGTVELDVCDNGHGLDYGAADGACAAAEEHAQPFHR